MTPSRFQIACAAALAALVTTGPVMAGPYAPAAGLPGSTAVSMTDSGLIAWAQHVTGYVPGADVDAIWQDTSKALGAAVGGPYDVLSLGNGGSVTLGFASPLANGPGWDFAVFENAVTDTFLELAFVEVSSDGTNFHRFANDSLTAFPVPAFGSINPTNVDGLAGKYRQGFGTPFDLASLSGLAGLDISRVSHLRLIDIVGDGSALDTSGNVIYDPHHTTISAGFDLDAVGARYLASATPVPLPATLILLLPVLGAFGLVGRRRNPSNTSTC